MSSETDGLSKTWQNIPKPPATPLAHRRRLAPNAGVHVSPFCLGAMSIGDQWSGLLGDMNRKSSFELLDAFFEAGGNFIDTANG
jgi:aryl-alcohol dehydrogenase-like predicted oxidoreductase